MAPGGRRDGRPPRRDGGDTGARGERGIGPKIRFVGIDEGAAPDDSPQKYLHTYSLTHDDHTFDDLGYSSHVTLPGWDEKLLPCGDRWYGAEE